jgi:hypothetical protein
MAQKITIALEDDLDGGPAEETVRFGLGGAEYEIDLSSKNAAASRRKLAPFIEHARNASVLSALARNRRVRITTAGYLTVAVFGVVAIVARWGFGVSGSGALVAGAIAAAPILIAFAGDRITGIKAFSVEISLAQITVRDQVDLTQAVMAIAEMGPSGSPELLTTLRNAIRARARLLRLNLHNDDYWWSTRVYLVAALAMDYTKVEQLLFVRGQEERVWIGMIDPPAARVTCWRKSSQNTSGTIGTFETWRQQPQTSAHHLTGTPR